MPSVVGMHMNVQCPHAPLIVQMQEPYYCMLSLDNWCWGCCRVRLGSCVNEDFLTFSAHILYTVL